MNAIDIIKQNDLRDIGEVSDRIITLDLEVAIIKSEVKIKLNTAQLPALHKKTEEIKILQGYLNSMVAKREVLTGLYNDVIATQLTRRLFCEMKSSYNDIEYGDIRVTCKRGGFILSDKDYSDEFIPANYKLTKIYNIIKCD